MSLNAILKLTHFLENNQTFPQFEELLPHLQAEAQEQRVNLQALENDPEVAAGWRRDLLYRNRLGLSSSDFDLLAQGPPLAPGPGAPAFVVAWRNYIKQLFKKGFMFRLSVNLEVTIYVSENKTLAGREDRGYEGEATGRKLVVSFFETLPDGLVRRTIRGGTSLHPQLLTIAEILQSCGFRLPVDHLRSSAAAEILLESQYQELEILRVKPLLDTEATEVHMYSLHEEVLAEEASALEAPAEQMTKMMLARYLQRHGDLQAGETLQAAWAQPLERLQARTAPLLRGRGPRGGGRGGRGRGRRGRGRGRRVEAP